MLDLLALERLAIVCLIPCLTVGCATAKIYRLDETFELEEASFDAGRLHVGILPVTYEPDDSDDNARIRDGVDRFEGHYFAARLARSLDRSGWFSGVYCLPEETAAADVLVAAHVNRSDGEVIDISFTLRDGAGRDLGEAEAGINLSSGDFEDHANPDPSKRLWVTATNRIGKALAESEIFEPARAAQSRISAYLGGRPAVDVAAGVGRDAASLLVWKAMTIEREKLLLPVTTVMVEQSDAIRPAYVRWQAETTRLLERKRRSRNWSVVLGVLSVANMGMSTYAVSQGVPANASTIQNANQVSAMGMVAALDSAQEASDLGGAVADLRGAFSQEVAPVTVKLGGTVYELVGSTEDQLRQIRAIVRNQILGGAGA
ncbi:MAG: hypothetical protein ACX98W_05095 [bacterium]